jgi:hypothetical protein
MAEQFLLWRRHQVLADARNKSEVYSIAATDSHRYQDEGAMRDL